jgi:hypothetical protein
MRVRAQANGSGPEQQSARRAKNLIGRPKKIVPAHCGIMLHCADIIVAAISACTYLHV